MICMWWDLKVIARLLIMLFLSSLLSSISDCFPNPRSCVPATAIFFPFPPNSPFPSCFNGFVYACPPSKTTAELLFILQYPLLKFPYSVKPNLPLLSNHPYHLKKLCIPLNKHLSYFLHTVSFLRLRIRLFLYLQLLWWHLAKGGIIKYLLKECTKLFLISMTPNINSLDFQDYSFFSGSDCKFVLSTYNLIPQFLLWLIHFTDHAFHVTEPCSWNLQRLNKSSDQDWKKT